MKIAFIGDCKGRVHSNRCEAMSKNTDISFDFFTIKKKNLTKICKKYDAVYYAAYTMYKRQKIKHPCLYGSATSWKCIVGDDNARDMKILSKFKALSANNSSLYHKLKEHCDNITYIPNGVDTSFFSPIKKNLNKRIRVGWVGNHDRAEKNYHIIDKLSKTYKEVRWDKVVTSKSMRSGLLSKSRMLDYYRSLDYLLVVSSYEGTPNPALEAAACGVPLISTRVGNMPEIIIEGFNGFFVNPKVSSVRNCLDRVLDMSVARYGTLSENIAYTMRRWDWSLIGKKFEVFFNG